MRYPEEELLGILKEGGVDLLCTLPCDRVKNLIALSDMDFHRVPLTREEEGVGICAGAALAGRRPAMIVQSSGIGNMVNALLSLTLFYKLPLAIFISHRGVYKEGIPAQVPMGRALPSILKSAGISYTIINERENLTLVRSKLSSLYEQGTVHAFLMSPAIWEGSKVKVEHRAGRCLCQSPVPVQTGRCPEPSMTRYEILEELGQALQGNVVVCNLGIPSKELFDILPQPSNFYMLGSMGMATPIGLGVAISTDKKVFVIDGDGSILMNPGTLATAAQVSPKNLTIVAIDNASYGSTGNQPTLTGLCVDLEVLAKGMGIANTFKVSEKGQLSDSVEGAGDGLVFVHALAAAGNRQVPNIPVGHLEVKRQFQDFLAS